ncbi:MAG: 2Fe-2S iron-sulfur cluster-binding protein [Thermodesulfobacteriota bacterium]|nr:2Fe-2S iron-sulfur cluster-binding protein [Thermodesulfobacteriota bacterium]
MSKINVEVLRYDPENGEEGTHVTYSLDAHENSTIMEALLKIYEENDSTLAFNYGCRVKNCGLCVVNVNGKPRYACTTRIEDNVKISPIAKVPVIKDLVFDRKLFYDFLNKFSPYVVRDKGPETLPEVLIQPYEHIILMSCRECFACVSVCPRYNYRDESFGGPLAFVKLAQLHYDCRDSVDRILQAQNMGIQKCIDCGRCSCISGIPVNRIVIGPFLENLKSREKEQKG